jgi:glyoxylase-like metal-dependent hydrolase (beta-lactamase superfamily II)
LRASGHRPEDIDEIYITHMGPDHIGGLTIGGERAFPNAVVRIAQREIDAFLNPPEIPKTNFWVEFRSAIFAPYTSAQRLQTFTKDVELAPGIRALATPGHTPGHTSFVVESKGQTLIVMGDLVHWGSVQFPFPAAYTSFDSDPKAATAERIRIFQMAADHRYLVAGSHLSFPGIGRIRASDGRFYWLPN